MRDENEEKVSDINNKLIKIFTFMLIDLKHISRN